MLIPRKKFVLALTWFSIFSPIRTVFSSDSGTSPRQESAGGLKKGKTWKELSENERKKCVSIGRRYILKSLAPVYGRTITEASKLEHGVAAASEVFFAALSYLAAQRDLEKHNLREGLTAILLYLLWLTSMKAFLYSTLSWGLPSGVHPGDEISYYSKTITGDGLDIISLTAAAAAIGVTAWKLTKEGKKWSRPALAAFAGAATSLAVSAKIPPLQGVDC